MPDQRQGQASRPGRARTAATGAAGGTRRGAGGALAGAAAGARRTGKKLRYRGKGLAVFGNGSPEQARKALMAELLVCVVVTALSPMTSKHQNDQPGQLLKRMTGVVFVFVILGLASTAGRNASRVAVAFGGLVAVALLLSDREIFSLTRAQLEGTGKAPAGPGSFQASAEDAAHQFVLELEGGDNRPGVVGGTL